MGGGGAAAQRVALGVGGRGLLSRGRQGPLVAVLVVQLVVPLQHQVAGPQHLRGGLGRGLPQGLRLADLPGEVGGPGRWGEVRGTGR